MSTGARNGRLILSLVVLLVGLAGGSSQGQYLERLLTVGKGPVAMALDTLRHRLFVVCQNSNTMAVVNADSLRVDAVISLSSKPTDVIAVPELGRVYVACAPGSGNGSVRVYDAEHLELVGAVGVGRSPVKLVYDAIDNRLGCLNRLSPSVSIIRCDSNRVVRNVSLSQTPEDIIWNPAANKFYVVSGAYMQSGRVTIINPRTSQVIKTLSTGEDGWRLACDPVRNLVYCSFRGSRTLAVVSGAADSILRSLRTESEVWALLWLLDDKLYSGNYWASSVSVLYGGDTGFGRTFHVAGGPAAFGFNPLTGRVYAAAYLDGRLSVIDSRTGPDVLWDSIGIGAGPIEIEVYLPENRVFVCNSWDSTVAVIRDELTGVGEMARGEPDLRGRQAVVVRQVLYLGALAGGASLVDAQGCVVLRLRAGANDVSRLAPGVYFLKTDSTGGLRRLLVVR